MHYTKLTAMYLKGLVESSPCNKYLEEMTRIGKIHPSSSAAGAPLFFAKQLSRKLRIVVDYRGLNIVTIKDKYPLPLMT